MAGSARKYVPWQADLDGFGFLAWSRLAVGLLHSVFIEDVHGFYGDVSHEMQLLLVTIDPEESFSSTR